MAVAWIESVVNYNSSEFLTFIYFDETRRPKRKDNHSVVQDGEKIILQPGQRIDFDNLCIPWSHANRYIEVKWNQAGKNLVSRFDIVGREAWDFIRTRDGENRELGTVEVGSMGDARGTNWSGWELALHDNCYIGMNQIYREGLTKNSAETMGRFCLSLASQVTSDVIKTSGTVIKSAGELAIALIAA